MGGTIALPCDRVVPQLEIGPVGEINVRLLPTDPRLIILTGSTQGKIRPSQTCNVLVIDCQSPPGLSQQVPLVVMTATVPLTLACTNCKTRQIFLREITRAIRA